MPSQAERDDDPRHHTENIHRKLTELVDHLRKDIGKVHEPKAQALFETSAEVLSGLMNAYEHYNEQRPAWRRSA
jgi:hypothetical protein